MKKQVLAILLTLTLLLSLLPMGAMAAEIETEETSQTEVSVVEEVTTEAETETEEAAPETEPEPEETEVSEEESAADVEEEVLDEEAVSEAEPEVEEEVLEDSCEETVDTYLASGGTCGENLTWSLSGGVLTISGSGPMINYGEYSMPWYDNRKEITSVVIRSGVTRIGEHAFHGCTNMTRVTIPYGVTVIGEQAFRYCESLNSVIVPDSVTRVGAYAFHGCTSLTSARIGNGVTVLGEHVFQDCISLASATIGNRVTNIGNEAFRNCRGLTSITIPNSVGGIDSNAFCDCISLTRVNMGSGVTNIDSNAFCNCQCLTGITIPNGVTRINWGTFSGCRSLTSVIIPASVTGISGYAFSECTGLADIYYGGSRISWEKLEVDNFQNANTCLLNATVHYTGPLNKVTVTRTNAHPTGNILYWNAVPDAELYQIFRRTSGQPFTYLRCASGLGVKDTTAKVGVTYIYAVRAVNGNRRSADYSNQVALTRPSNIPANVKITGKNAHKTGNILYWNSVSGAKFYQIFRRTSGQSFEWIANTGGAAYKDETANPGVTYIYAIKAHNGSVKSAAYSNTVAMTRPRG